MLNQYCLLPNKPKCDWEIKYKKNNDNFAIGTIFVSHQFGISPITIDKVWKVTLNTTLDLLSYSSSISDPLKYDCSGGNPVIGK